MTNLEKQKQALIVKLAKFVETTKKELAEIEAQKKALAKRIAILNKKAQAYIDQ